ncbi:hypothetical protein L7750_09905 [Xenorhabdus bovienii]|uniref:hypothetical protein n=1 Tax=Xenorhabdus bovienii TaxID=40576 RepID=UPI001EDCFA0A|nr:hypothetical protein [Xenorhabdus bovienii]MCG3470696.1 hypothetical protein [Xenorhabdus bovienii]
MTNIDDTGLAIHAPRPCAICCPGKLISQLTERQYGSDETLTSYPQKREMSVWGISFSR